MTPLNLKPERMRLEMASLGRRRGRPDRSETSFAANRRHPEIGRWAVCEYPAISERGYTRPLAGLILSPEEPRLHPISGHMGRLVRPCWPISRAS